MLKEEETITAGLRATAPPKAGGSYPRRLAVPQAPSLLPQDPRRTAPPASGRPGLQCCHPAGGKAEPDKTGVQAPHLWAAEGWEKYK